MKSRAMRRHHEKRIKSWIRNDPWMKSTYALNHRKDVSRIIGKLTNSRTLCSCWMCGNPRKYYKAMTFQERRIQQESLRSLLEESLALI